MSDDQPQPPEKKFVKTGTVIRETITEMQEPKDNSKKSEKKSD